MKRALRDVASESDANVLQRFFKTGRGQYGFGDQFLGVRVPATRRVLRAFPLATLDDALALLESKWHEERLLALLLMVRLYDKGADDARQHVYDAYLANARFVNNWDLVDTSAAGIVGRHLDVIAKPRGVLERLVQSSTLWDRRIAMIATFHQIRGGDMTLPLWVAEQLVHDSHDLMHKAVGWMLREIGDRDLAAERAFLDRHLDGMPRTMLRYAIEKFPEPLRLRYLRGEARLT